MNLPTNSLCARPSTATRDCASRPDCCEDRRRGDDFERVLRAKSERRDDQPDDEGDAPPSLLPYVPAPALSMAAAQRAAAAACGLLAPEASATAAKAGLGAAQDAPSGAATPAGLRQDTAGAWAVTLNDPRGLALDLQATRPGGAQPAGAAAAWSVTIGAGVHDAALLARHAPRLNERLQARTVTHTHVRIQEGNAHPEER